MSSLTTKPVSAVHSHKDMLSWLKSKVSNDVAGKEHGGIHGTHHCSQTKTIPVDNRKMGTRRLSNLKGHNGSITDIPGGPRIFEILHNRRSAHLLGMSRGEKYQYGIGGFGAAR